jgi:hypothetical protein
MHCYFKEEFFLKMEEYFTWAPKELFRKALLIKIHLNLRTCRNEKTGTLEPVILHVTLQTPC